MENGLGWGFRKFCATVLDLEERHEVRYKRFVLHSRKFLGMKLTCYSLPDFGQL